MGNADDDYAVDDPWKHVGFTAGRPTALLSAVADEVFRLSGATFGPLVKKLFAELPSRVWGERPDTNVLHDPKEMLQELEDNQPKFYALVVAARGTISGLSMAAVGAEFLNAGVELRGVDINGLACIPTIEDIKSCPDEYAAPGGITSFKELWQFRLGKSVLEGGPDEPVPADCIESFRTEFVELHGIGANVLSLLERSVDAGRVLGVAL